MKVLVETEMTIESFAKHFPSEFEHFKQEIYEAEELDSEYYRELLSERCREAGLDHSGNDKFYYSVGFCQGDGASFECDFWPNKIETPEQYEKEKQYHNLRAEFPLVFALGINRLYSPTITMDKSAHYVHEMTMEVRSEMPPDPEDGERFGGPTLYANMLYKDVLEQTLPQLAEFEEALLEVARSIAKQLHSDMENEVMSWWKDEYCIERLKCNYSYKMFGNSHVEEVTIDDEKVIVSHWIDEESSPKVA